VSTVDASPTMNRLATSVLASLSLALACTAGAPAPSEPVEPEDAASTDMSREALAQAQAFQAQYEAELRADDRSFLTVVDAHYLAPGETLGLALVDGAWVEHADASLRFESSAEALRVTTDEDVERFDDRASLPLDDEGRFALGISRQGEAWRVLIHDRDAELRASFPGIEWFPPEATAIVDARFEPRASREPMLLQTSRGETKTLHVAGEAHFELAGEALSLLVFAYAPEPSEGEALLIPFRDATTGHESYAAGRYLEPSPPREGLLRLDFNRATNPLCAYSEHFNCPMPPRFNALSVAIRAGAMAPH
jgi:uncharacterized protein (DUF1684 family)